LYSVKIKTDGTNIKNINIKVILMSSKNTTGIEILNPSRPTASNQNGMNDTMNENKFNLKCLFNKIPNTIIGA
jgi:hypothetical protein